ncbi:hypothetical protein INR49_001633 [Caranx melampygus]|nr:hypothetical protein INR49_001633 [Caranx melampygus]
MAAPLLEKLSESLGSRSSGSTNFIDLIGYPFALCTGASFPPVPTVIHLFHTLSGLALAAFNFGEMKRKISVLELWCPHVFCLNFSLILILLQLYLLAGYYYTATEEYDIKWTMPHCVLMLKLVGLSFDYYDGGKEPSQLSLEQKKAALPSVPSLLEVCGFSYFYGGFLVGPQFTLRSYQRLVAGELTDCPGKPPNSVVPAMKRFALEGVCILSGLGYNGVVDGKPQWDACANMKVWLFETTPLFGGTISSFNINTNAWAARHVFKRLKFLGNKTLSHVTTLIFLTIWHGLHSGYILCFSMEFFIITVERQALALVRDSPLLTKLANSALYPLIYVVQQFIHWLFMGYPLVPFCLFTYDKWLKVTHNSTSITYIITC